MGVRCGGKLCWAWKGAFDLQGGLVILRVPAAHTWVCHPLALPSLAEVQNSGDVKLLQVVALGGDGVEQDLRFSGVGSLVHSAWKALWENIVGAKVLKKATSCISKFQWDSWKKAQVFFYLGGGAYVNRSGQEWRFIKETGNNAPTPPALA